MASIFDKYKATSTKTVKKLTAEEDTKTASGKRAGKIDITEGLNKLRLGPKHPGEETFMHLRGCHWIKIEKDDEVVNRTVNNARIHLDVPDPVESYVDFCRVRLADGESDNAKKLQDMTAWKGGLLVSVTWWSYAKKIKKDERGPWEIFEYYRIVRDAMKDSMVIEDEDEAIELDPFTDPLTGRCLMLTLKKEKGKSKTYTKLADNPTKLTLEEMEAYDKLTPISKLPDLNYSMSDYETAIEGLQYWDESKDINLFAEEEFQEILKGIKKQIITALGGAKVTASDEDESPFEEDKKAKTNKKPVAKPGKKAPAPAVEEEPEEEATDEEDAPEEEGEEAPESDKFGEMDRQELVAYKAEKGYDIKLLKSDTDDDMRNKLREVEVEIENQDNSEPEAEEETKPSKPVATTTPKKKLSLEDIKDKMKNKSGK